MGTLFGEPVVLHSGNKRNGYSHLAILTKGGRLRGLGERQERQLKRKQEVNNVRLGYAPI